MEKYSLLFILLTFFVGITTSISDTLYQKIKNKHLLIALIAILSCYAYLAAVVKIQLNPWIFFLNAFFGLAIGFFLYSTKTWGGGDGKLFFIYSLLLSQNRYATYFPFSSITVFVNIFVFSTLCVFLYYIFQSFKMFKRIKWFSVFKTLVIRLFYSYVTVACFGWIFTAAIRQLNQKPLPVFTRFFLAYLIFLIAFQIGQSFFKKFPRIFLICIAVSLLSRYFATSQLAFHGLSLKSTFLFTTFLYLTLNTLAFGEVLEKSNPVFPFAIFMLGGTLLSWTDFLYGIIYLMCGHV